MPEVGRATTTTCQFVEAVRGNGTDVGPVQLLRPADGDGAARLPGHAVPEDRPEVGRGELKVTNVAEANQFVRRAVPQGLGGAGAVT